MQVVTPAETDPRERVEKVMEKLSEERTRGDIAIYRQSSSGPAEQPAEDLLNEQGAVEVSFHYPLPLVGAEVDRVYRIVTIKGDGAVEVADVPQILPGEGGRDMDGNELMICPRGGCRLDIPIGAWSMREHRYFGPAALGGTADLDAVREDTVTFAAEYAEYLRRGDDDDWDDDGEEGDSDDDE